MDWNTIFFVLAIVAIVTAGRLVSNWMRMRHGYAPEERGHRGRRGEALTDNRQLTLLSSENADLKGKIVRLEERLAVVERIVTDKGARLADEIEALR